MQDFNPRSLNLKRNIRWKNRHSGEQCILMCNGPSLNAVDFSSIELENYTLFGLNKIHLLFDTVDFRPEYIAAVNTKVIEQSLEVYKDLDIVKFISNRFKPQEFPQNPYTYYLKTVKLPADPKRFHDNICEYTHEGWTVTHVALQIIYYMGFDKVFIVGMDHHFKQFSKGLENQTQVIHGADVDHFHPDYFGHGKDWDLPDLKNSEISYQTALEAYQSAGKKIYDCTVNGACEIFPKLDINHLYTKPLKAEKKDIAHASKGKLKIVYFPEFSRDDDINYSLIRASWYLSCITNSEITIHSAVQASKLNCFNYYDPSCNDKYQAMLRSGQLQLTTACDRMNLFRSVNDADIIILWKDGIRIQSVFTDQEIKALSLTTKKIYAVGPSRRMEASIYIEVSKDITAFDDGLIQQNQLKFQQLYQRYADTENAYLFATGPSSDAYKNYSFPMDNSIKIICNSIINDEEMLATIQPNILVFADPIFHFGCSTYAKAFRRRLVDVSNRYDLAIIIPIKYYHLFCYHLPELSDTVIGLPHYKNIGLNLDLNQAFYVNTIDNILTFLMLPIATSLAKNIYLIGCDGRPLHEDDYFWGHNTKTQFTGEMVSIQKAHPSFFQIDYNEYYLNHINNLEKYIDLLERENFRLFSMWGSFIPALSQRLCIPPALESQQITISICPDLSDDFGHWLHYEKALSGATKDLYIALGNKNLSANPKELFIAPVFSEKTFAFRRNNTEQSKQALIAELSTSLNTLLQNTANSVNLKFVMYTGDIQYIEDIYAVISKLNQKVSFTINLFYSHFDYDMDSNSFTNNGQLYKKYINPDYLKNNTWLKLCVDSKKMQRIFHDHFGVEINLWPMVNIDINADTKRPKKNNQNNQDKLVVFPGNGQYAKGFDIACAFIKKYGKRLSERYNCRFLLRSQFRDSAANNKQLELMLTEIDVLPYVQLAEGVLDSDEFLDLFFQADIIILPYRQKSFYTRTSACVVNALLSEAKIIVTKNTWMAEQIELFSAGRTFTDGDIDSMHEAFCKLMQRTEPAADINKIMEWYKPENVIVTINSDK